MRIFHYLLVLIMLCGNSVSSFASPDKNEKKLVKKARKALAEGEFGQAKQLYAELNEKYPNNQDYLFEEGLVYYNSEVQRERSALLFRQALLNAKTDTIPELLLYLGKSHHYIHQFDKAIVYYNMFRDNLEKEGDALMLSSEVGRFIEMCNMGIELQEKEDKNIKVYSISEKINSPFGEYAPILTKDETIMIFTARKEGSTGGDFFYDNKYFEDIYVATKEGEDWNYPTKFDSSGLFIGEQINFKKHDAAIGLNEDETKLFIYRDKDVWVSEKVDGKWGEPIRMNKNINTAAQEPSVFISKDEKTLYLVSDRGAGDGGRDIFVSKLQGDGTWGPVSSMGPSINTKYDEDAPFLTPDGRQFYFSSKGHNTIGGYDIFRCTLNPDSTWSEPENLGMPINSAGDDIYYLLMKENTIGYMASSRMNGEGDLDIYRVELECKNLPNTEIRGLVLAGNKKLPIGARMVVKDKESGQEIGTYTADRQNGKYFMILEPNKTYSMDLFADGFTDVRAHYFEFTVPKQCEYFQMYQEINIKRWLDTTTNRIEQEAVLQNAFFDIFKTIQEEYKLNRLAEDGSHLSQMISPDADMGISGRLSHNKSLPVKNTKVLLVNSKNEVVRVSKTDDEGNFRFLHVPNDDEYRIMISEEDSKISYYGDIVENTETDVQVMGTLGELKGKDSLTTMNGFTIYLSDNDNKVVNQTTTNDKGEFTVDNTPENKDAIDKINASSSFPYNFDMSDPDEIFSAFIQTIDPNNSDLYYTEYFDKLFLESLSMTIPEFENIYFDFDKFFLRDKSKEVLDKIAEFLLNNRNVSLYMSAHCDWMGPDAYNIKLSEKRAQSAWQYLADKGVKSERMKREWFGERRPAVPNANPDGSDNPDNRQLNRRVEFVVNIPKVGELVLAF